MAPSCSFSLSKLSRPQLAYFCVSFPLSLLVASLVPGAAKHREDGSCNENVDDGGVAEDAAPEDEGGADTDGEGKYGSVVNHGVAKLVARDAIPNELEDSRGTSGIAATYSLTAAQSSALCSGEMGTSSISCFKTDKAAARGSAAAGFIIGLVAARVRQQRLRQSIVFTWRAAGLCSPRVVWPPRAMLRITAN